jgi:arsenite methyltransferase
LRDDKILWGEGLAGALYIEDFRRIMNELGFKDCRIINKTAISINDPEI